MKRVASSFFSGATSLNPACWWKCGRKWYLANTLARLPLLAKLPLAMTWCSPSKAGVEKSCKKLSTESSQVSRAPRAREKLWMPCLEEVSKCAGVTTVGTLSIYSLQKGLLPLKNACL